MNQPIFQTLDRTAKYPYARSDYAKRLLWNLVQATLFRFSLSRSYGWRRFLAKCFGAKLGHKAALGNTTRIFHPWLLTMGDWTNIAAGVTIYNLGQVTIGDHTVLSQDVYICAGTHDYTDPTLPLQRTPITIGSGVWIAAGAFVCPGITIENNVVVAARAVVTKDVEEGVVVGGNPGRVLKRRTHNSQLTTHKETPKA